MSIYLPKYLPLILLHFIILRLFSQPLGPGDIAFIAFNADGDDDFAIVVLRDIGNDTIYFTDKETNEIGMATEGTLRWITGATTIAAGTVVTFTDATSAGGVSVGLVTEIDAGFNLAAGGDAILAFTGPNENTPTAFLAGFQNATGNFGSLAATGLKQDTTAITITKAGANDDGAIYVGPRNTEFAFGDYIDLIRNSDNWTTDNTDGETLFMSFDNTNFSLFTCPVIPTPCVTDIGLCFDGQKSTEIIPERSDSLVLMEDFETAGLNTRYFLDRDTFTTLNDTSLSAGNQGKSFLTRTDGSNIRSTSFMFDSIRGMYWFGAADLNKNTTTLPGSATMTFSQKAIKGLCDLQFSVYLAEDDVSGGATNHWNREDFVHFDYSIDGSAFQNLLHIENDGGVAGSAPFVDTNFDGDGEGTEVTDTFQRFVVNIMETGQSITLRISMFLDGEDEDIAIDSIRILGSPARYNFYDNDPAAGGMLLADSVASFDPMVTLATSPQTIWVESVCGQCKSDAVPVIVAVRPPGDDGIACFDEVNISLNNQCKLDDLKSNAFYAGPLAPVFFDLKIKTQKGDSVSKDSLHNFLGMRLIYEIIDTCNENRCWGYLNLEDKLPPKASPCPCDASITANLNPATAPDSCKFHCLDSIFFHQPTFIDNCSKQLHADSLNIFSALDSIEIGCDSLRFTWTWNYRNENHNPSLTEICKQVYYRLPLSFDSIKWPQKKLNLACDSVSLSAAPMEIASAYAKSFSGPYIINNVNDTLLLSDSSQICNFAVFRQDQIIDVCVNETKIIRNWTVVDWCRGASLDSVRIVTVKDKQPPDFGVTSVSVNLVGTDQVVVDGDTVSIDSLEVMVEVDVDKIFQLVEIRNPWGCAADFEIPIFENLKDNCSDQERVTLTYEVDAAGAFFDENHPRIVRNLPEGTSSIMLTATDECGNTSTHTLTLSALDMAEPVALCADTLGTVLIDDSDFLDGSVAQIPVESFDLNSFDGCGKIILILARRSDGKFSCGGNSLQSISTTYIEFCCEDIGNYVPISATFFDDFGNTSECTSYVKVQNKNEPIIICEDLVIGCNDAIQPEHIGMPNLFGICETPDLEYEDEYYVDDLCFTGYIKRRWRVVGTNVQCVQTITINDTDGGEENANNFDPRSIHWPLHYTGENFDEFVARIDGFGIEDVIVKDVNEHEQCEDFQFHGTIKAHRASHVRAAVYSSFKEFDKEAKRSDFLQSCIMNDQFYCEIGDLNEPYWIDPKCGFIGKSYTDETFNFNGASCFKVVRKWAVIDWCVWQPNENEADSQNGENDKYVLMKDLCADISYFKYDYDLTEFDGYYAWDQEIKIADDTQPRITPPGDVTVAINAANKASDGICEGTLEITAKATDFCGEQMSSGEGTANERSELKWSVELVKLVGEEESTIQNFQPLDGIDSRGDSISYTLTGRSGERFKIKWRVVDGCNNVAEEVSFVYFKDLNAPVIICLATLSTSIEPPTFESLNTNGHVTIWASDYAEAYDCDENETAIYFKDEEGNPTPSSTLTCDDVWNALFADWQGNVYARDTFGNESFCEVSLKVVDANDACIDFVDGWFDIEGNIRTEFGDMVEGADVYLNHGYKRRRTSASGHYLFEQVVLGVRHNITARKTNDYANGVSAQDMVLTQRHILGTELLDSPYKVIAADVNNDKKVSATDLILMRKLILGVHEEFSFNDSWRFINPSHIFENVLNPFPFAEDVYVYFHDRDIVGKDFIGVKIGDVSGDAIANSLMTEPRSKASITLMVEDKNVRAGQNLSVAVSSSDFKEMNALQFTMDMAGLEFVGVESGALEVTEENIAVHEDAISMIWYDVDPVSSREALFHLRFRGNKNASISNLLSISSEITDHTTGHEL